MNKISRFTYTVLVMLVTAGLMTGGFIVGFSVSSKEKFYKDTEALQKQKAKAVENNIKENTETVDAASKNTTKKEYEEEKEEDEEEISQSKDIKVSYIDYYKKCDHTVTSKVNIFGSSIEDVKKNLSEDIQKKGYKLTKETEDTLTYKKTYDQYCTDHYIVILEGEQVKVYMQASDGIKIEYQTLNTVVSKIRDEMLERLKEGIKVDSRNDLYSLIEEIES